jgi:hypothetical protein
MKRGVAPYLLLAILGLACFGELVCHPGQVLYSGHSDLLAMHLPMKCFLVRSWQETGEVPLWCPNSFAGMPFVHDVQVAAFYPPHVPLYLLPERWVGAALSWLVVFHVILAGWLMFGYARSKGLEGVAALVAAMGWMFGGKWLLHLLAGGHYIMVPLAWLPLVLRWFEQALARRSLLRATWAGGAFALIVTGAHPQMTLYAGLFVAIASLWTVWDGSAQPSGIRQSSRKLTCSRLGHWFFLGAWTAVTAVILSAVQLLPALEAAPEASRAVGVDFREILAVTLPCILGMVGPGWTPTWEDRAGLSLVWIAAALAAPLINPGRSRFYGLLCLSLLAFGLGGAALFQWLPGFRLFQIPSRMLMFVAFPLSLLAGQTTQALIAMEPAALGACRRLVLRVAFVGFLFAAVTALADQAMGSHERIATAAWWTNEAISAVVDWVKQRPVAGWLYWAVCCFTVPLSLWLLSKCCRLGPRTWAASWVGILLADLWALSWPQVAVRPIEAIYPIPTSVQYLATCREANPSQPWRVLDRSFSAPASSKPLGSALPQLGGVQIEPVLGYNSFDVRRYKEYLQFILDQDFPVQPRQGIFGYPIVADFPIRNKSLLDLLGTRFVLQPRTAMPFQGVQEPGATDDWRLVAQDPRPTVYSFLAGGMQSLSPYCVYENAAFCPRTFVVYDAMPLAVRPQLLHQLKTTNFSERVLLEEANEQELGSARAERGRYEAAHIVRYSPNQVSVQAEAETAGYLVLADVWFPGWRCTVNGVAAKVFRADYAFRAVALPPGRNEVVFTFSPASYSWGKRVSALGLAALAVWTVIGLLGRRQETLFERVRGPNSSSR